MDLGSANGTFVNEVRLTSNVPLRLRSGDTCRLGSFTLIYEEQPFVWESTGRSYALDDTDEEDQEDQTFPESDRGDLAEERGQKEPPLSEPQQQGTREDRQ